jgi:hypothetical protein
MVKVFPSVDGIDKHLGDTHSAHIVQRRCQSATIEIHMHIWDRDLVDSEIALSTRNGKDRVFQVPTRRYQQRSLINKKLSTETADQQG